VRAVIPLAILIALSAAPGFARTWTGSLVDSKCYAAMERNANPTTTLQDVNRDRLFEIRYCHPSPKTKSFTLVDYDGQSVNLDDAGDAKASALVQSLGKRRYYEVDVTGQLVGKAIQVDSISETPQQ
jgi:hypothetical protein